MTTKHPRVAGDFDPAVLRLFDQYVHGAIDRRGFLEAATRFAAGAAGAAGLLAALSPSFAAARQVLPNDPRIDARYLEFDSPQGYGKGRGYLVRPKESDNPQPVVLVVHENRGLNPHIEDIARRLALDDFIAFAPDALFPLGGYPGDEDAARTLFATLEQGKSREDFVAAAKMLMSVPGGNGRLGAVGFCYGGGIVNVLATRLPELAVAVPFYGSPPPLADVALIKAEMLLVFAETDDRINASWPDYQAALEQGQVRYEVFKPSGTQHGFNNDTTPRFDAQAARVAWSKTTALLARSLRIQA